MKEGWTESGQNSRVSPMSEKKRFERLFLYALFGYMIKVRAGAGDLTPTDNASLHEQCSSFRPTRARVTPAPSNAPRLRTTRDTPSPSIPQDMWIFRRDFCSSKITSSASSASSRFLPSRGCRVFRGRRDRAGARQLHLQHRPPHGKRFVQGRPASGETLRRDAVRGVHAPVELRGRDDVRVVFSSPKLKGTPWVYGLGAAWFTLIAGREHVHLSRSVPYFREHAVRRAAREKSNADAAETLKKVKKKI